MFQLVFHPITDNETFLLPTAHSIFQTSSVFIRKIQVLKINTFAKLWIYSTTLNFISRYKFHYNCHYIFVIRKFFSKKIAWFGSNIFVVVAGLCMLVYLSVFCFLLCIFSLKSVIFQCYIYNPKKDGHSKIRYSYINYIINVMH